MANGVLRFGGMPTDAEVNMLMERFGVPQEDKPIPYTEITATLRYEKESNRWGTVVDAWRRRLERDHNVILKAGGGQFVAMTPSDRITHSGSRVKSGVRRIRKAGSIVASTDRGRLSEQDKARADHITIVTAALSHAALEQTRKLPVRLPEPVTQQS